MDVVLYVGDRNVSSWSMRAWLALTEKGVEFSEKLIRLDEPGTRATLTSLSPSGRVPVLLHGGMCIYDSLAIMEYVNEAFDGPALMPAETPQRGRARSLLAWMHSGFAELRSQMPFEDTFGTVRGTPSARAVAEARGLVAALEDQLAHSGGPYLFGPVGLADLTFVPVLRRLEKFGVPLVGDESTPFVQGEVEGQTGSRVQAWATELMARPSVRQWMREAEALPPRGTGVGAK